MERAWTAITAGLMLMASSAVGAQAPAAAAPETKSSPLVVRVSLDLVRIDAVVTDAKGHYVTDLKAADFRILQDGKAQEITSFEYVRTADERLLQAVPTQQAGAAGANPLLRAEPIRPEQVRRSMALIVDDLTLSFQGVEKVRKALDKLVDEQLGPGDLAAVVRTGGGTGMLQQFTSDKRLLHAAIQALRYNPLLRERGGLSPTADRAGAVADVDDQTPGEFDDFRLRTLGLGTMGGIRFVLEGLQQLPGRKSAVLFSERLAAFGRGNTVDPIIGEWLQLVTDLANRASTVLYTVDPQGLSTGLATGGLRAESSGRPGDSVKAGLAPAAQLPRTIHQSLEDRADAQGGLRILAERTGGLFFPDENNLGAALARVIEDQRGYYLLGYAPDASTFEALKLRARFHDVKVTLERPGLTVRSRSGFIGVPDEERPRTAADPLASALLSPFAATELPVRLTSVFGYDPARGYLVRSFLHVAGAALGLPSGHVSGTYRSKLELMATALGDNGVSVDGGRRSLAVPVAAADLERVRRAGTVLVFTMPLHKPGVYQLRIALRNPVTGQIGAASELVTVPDLSTRRLALSGVMLGNVRTTSAAQQESSASDLEIAAPEDDPEMSPAVRRFRSGSELLYVAAVYNPKLEGGQARLETRLRLVSGGQGDVNAPQPPAGVRRLDVPQPGPTRGARPVNPTPGVKSVPIFAVFGKLLLPADLSPGEYALELLVTDQLEKGKNRTTSQWVVFEVISKAQTSVLLQR